ncbi:DUF349 domain-containing protein [Arcanobacterium hippocoleae]|uniref:DUF349 domain-containing protein n=1 Tax=Arcanobacterium hippocoleae TaxID=149017 RepID=A0ABU1T026_9ACTO|nr:DUF349 domain-containing protein [Arcanobacterium hippocoleae]MDR6938736.1 hypothetical protein [Arcanobacterium hippocoleae]
MADNTQNIKPVPTPKAHVLPTATLKSGTDEAALAAAKWGRVDEDGNVYLRLPEGERLVGQYTAGGTATDALNLYVRRFLDLQAQVALLETRLEHISPEEARKSLQTINNELVEPAVVGDVESLRERAQDAEVKIAQRAEVVAAQRAQAKAEALTLRTEIVERAEAIAEQEVGRIHWRNSRDELAQLLDQWKQAQRKGARIDRATEDELWKRFSAARTKFDRHRRQHFSELDAQRKQTIALKEDIIKRAEKLQDSSDWGNTAAAYRDLLEEWKRAGRSTKKDDDKLWERFRAAQQVFFDARAGHNAAIDEEFGANLTAKLALLAEAEKLLPVEDVEYAKAQIRAIGEKWDAIGRVPRADVTRTEGRMREIERAIRDAENQQWADADSELNERSMGMAAQLQALITELEEQLAQAQSAGDEQKIKEYTDALEARKAWLSTVLDS